MIRTYESAFTYSSFSFIAPCLAAGCLIPGGRAMTLNWNLSLRLYLSCSTVVRTANTTCTVRTAAKGREPRTPRLAAGYASRSQHDDWNVLRVTSVPHHKKNPLYGTEANQQLQLSNSSIFTSCSWLPGIMLKLFRRRSIRSINHHEIPVLVLYKALVMMWFIIMFSFCL